jgi:hypothetical protein
VKSACQTPRISAETSKSGKALYRKHTKKLSVGSVAKEAAAALNFETLEPRQGRSARLREAIIQARNRLQVESSFSILGSSITGFS